MNIADRTKERSQELDENALIKELLDGILKGCQKTSPEIFGKGYEFHAFSINAKNYSRPVEIAIGIPVDKGIDPEVEDKEIDEDLLAFNRELERFRKILPELMKTYLYEFVAVLSGKVVDHDKNEFELAKRIYRDYSSEIVLIRQVKEEIAAIYHLESPEGIVI